jgi:hypothetical protein
MPREFDELRPESLPPSLNAPRARASALSELTGGRPPGQVDILGEFRRTRGPGALARALDRDLAPMFDPYGRDQMMYENRAGAAFGVPGRGMFRRKQAFQGPEFSMSELGTPEGVYDAGPGRPIIGAPQVPQSDPGYDHLGPFIEQQLRKNQSLSRRQFGGKVDAGEAVVTGEAGPETFVPHDKRPPLPPGFRWTDVPAVKDRPALPKGFRWVDEPSAKPPPSEAAPKERKPGERYTPVTDWIEDTLFLGKRRNTTPVTDWLESTFDSLFGGKKPTTSEEPPPPPESGMLERAGQAIRSTLMGAPPGPPEAPQVPGQQPQPPAPAAHPMAPPGGAPPPVMMPSSGALPPPAPVPPPPSTGPDWFGPRGALGPGAAVDQFGPAPPPQAPAFPMPVPRSHLAPRGAPQGFQGNPPIVQRGGKFYTIDAAGNLIPLPVGGANGNAVE